MEDGFVTTGDSGPSSMADAFAAALAKVDAPETSTAAVSQTATSTEVAPVVAEAEATAPTEAAPAADAAPAEADPDAVFFRDLGKSNLSQEAKNAAAAAYRRDKELRELGWKPEDIRELRELGLPHEEAVELRQMFPTRDDAHRTVALANDLNRLLTEFETQPSKFVENLLHTAEQSGNVQAFDAVYNVFEKHVLGWTPDGKPQNPAAIAFFEKCARNFFTNHLNGQDADRAEAAKIFLEKDFAKPAQPDPVIARREQELAERERRFNEERQRTIQEADDRFIYDTYAQAGALLNSTVETLVAESTKGWPKELVDIVTQEVLGGSERQMKGDEAFLRSMSTIRQRLGNTGTAQQQILGEVKTKMERVVAAHRNNSVKRYNGLAQAHRQGASTVSTAPPHREPSATNITSGAKPVEKPLDFSTTKAKSESFATVFQQKLAAAMGR